METIILPVLFAILAVSTLGSSADVPQCPRNEQFSTCASPCQPNCQNSTNVKCPRICIRGCVCREGYIREGERGSCVPSCEKVPVCGENEEFATCGSACPRTCGDEGVKPCPLICVKGCVCKNGYLRERSGWKCITEEQCGKDGCGNVKQFLTECYKNLKEDKLFCATFILNNIMIPNILFFIIGSIN